jgi:predicted nuclease of predicted toxin-antitoxin system
MKIKLDENMPQALAALLRSAGYDVATVAEEGLSGADDSSVLVGKVTLEGRLLMTFDKDFVDIRHYPIEIHAGIVVFRLRDQRWVVLRASIRVLKQLLTMRAVGAYSRRLQSYHSRVQSDGYRCR